MAKLRDYDSRAYMIDRLSGSDNMSYMRNAGYGIDNCEKDLMLSIEELKDFLYDGVKVMEQLFGSAVTSFEPYNIMQEMEIRTFFSKLFDGYKKVEDKNTEHIDYISKLEKAEYELSDALLKHNFKKEFEANFALDCLKKSEYMHEKKLENEAIVNGELEVEPAVYEEAVEMHKFYKKYKEYISLGEKEPIVLEEVDEDVKFYVKIQNMITSYVLNMFLKGEYFENLHTSPVRYLMDYSGGIKVDYEHLFLLYEYLKSVKNSKARAIEPVLCYYAICRFYFDCNYTIKKRVQGSISFRVSNTTFNSLKYRAYEHSYYPAIFQPRGFRCYTFEIQNLAQRVYLASYDKDNISVENLIDKFNETKKTLNRRTKGLLFPFLQKEDENNLMPFMLNGSFPINEMTGSFSEFLKTEYKERRENFNIAEAGDLLTDMYSRVLKPIALDILGSFLARCCNKFKVVDGSVYPTFPFIYYVSAQRIGFAIPESMSEEEMKKCFKVDVSDIIVPCKVPTFKEVWDNKIM